MSTERIYRIASLRQSDDGWFSRGCLPHLNRGSQVQFVTIRLFDSLPQSVLVDLEKELKAIPPERQALERRRRIEALTDAGHGSCMLANPSIARLVENALLFMDAKRLRLHDWSIMPNHLHFLATILPNEELCKIMQSFKSYTSHQANWQLGRSGPFWFRDYYDRFVRNDKHYLAVRQYIESNPVKAGLCAEPEQWKFGSARRKW